MKHAARAARAAAVMAAICALVAAAVEPLHPAAHARLQHVSPHETSAFATDALLPGALAHVDGVSTPDASSHQPADDELVAPPQQGGADEPSANATEPDAQTDGAELTRDHARIVFEEPAVSVDTLSGSGNDLVAPADVQALDTLLENPVAPAEAGELSNAAAPSIPGIYALNKEDGSAASHVQSPEHTALQTLRAVDDRVTAMLLEQHDDHVVPDNVANNSDTSNAHVDEGAMPHGRLAFASISSTDPEPRAHGAHVGEHEDQHQLPFATVAQPPENMRNDIAYLEGVNNVDVRATVHEPEPQQHRAGKSVLVAPPVPDVDVQDGEGVYVPSGAESLAVPSVSIDTESVDAYEGHIQGIRVVHRSSGGLPFAGKERQCDNTTIVVPRSDMQPVLVLGSEKRREEAWSHTEDEFSALPHDGVDTHDLSRDETSRTAADPRSTLHSESTASELPPVPNAEHAPNKRVEAERSATVVTPAVVHAEGHEAAAAPVPQHERIEQNENDLPDVSAVTSMTASGLFLEPEAIDAIRGQRQSDDDDAHSLLTDDASKASARENDSMAAVENEHDALAMNSAAGGVKESNERNYNPALIVEVAGIDNNLVSREPLPLTDNSINRFDETVSQGDADDLENPPEHAHNEEIFTSSSILMMEPRDEDVGATEDENAQNGFDHPSALAMDEPFANDEAARGTAFHAPPAPLDTVAQSINNLPPPEQVQTQLGADPIASSTPGARPAHPGEADANATLATATEPTAQLKARAVSPDHSLFIMSSGLELPLQGQGVGNAGADGGGLQVGAQTTQPPVEPTAAPPPAVIVHSPGLALARDELVTPVEAEMFDLASVRHRMFIPHRHVRASKSRLLSHKEVDAGHEAAYATGHAHISFMDIDDTVVTAGHAHACAITADAQHMDEDAIGGPVVCWGDEEANVLNPPQALFTQLSASDGYTCGITVDRALLCWGDLPFPNLRFPTGAYHQVSAGVTVACAVRETGELACEGLNDHQQALPPSGLYGQVSCGKATCCAIEQSGALRCWGFSSDGSTKVPTGRYTQVSVGGSGTVCALQANAQDMRCWGAALIRRRKAVHAALQRHDAYLQVATADQAVCGVLANGELDCFGNVAALWHRTPPPTPAELVLQLSIHDENVCALLADASGNIAVRCWSDGNVLRVPPGLIPFVLDAN